MEEDPRGRQCEHEGVEPIQHATVAWKEVSQSFTPASRFVTDSARSPSWAITPRTAPMAAPRRTEVPTEE